MSNNYFENLRKISAKVDEGIIKLRETWKMPHLLLCKNKEDEKIANKLVQNLKNELQILKQNLEDNKINISYLQDINTQFLKESIKDVRTLKEEIDDTKILFAENGYVNESMEHNLSTLNSQLDSLLVNDKLNTTDVFVKNSIDFNEVTAHENVLHGKYPKTKDDINTNFQTNDISFTNLQKKSLNEQPIKPLYSPYYFEIMKD